MSYYTYTQAPIGRFVERDCGNYFEYSLNDDDFDFEHGQRQAIEGLLDQADLAMYGEPCDSTGAHVAEARAWLRSGCMRVRGRVALVAPVAHLAAALPCCRRARKWSPSSTCVG